MKWMKDLKNMKNIMTKIKNKIVHIIKKYVPRYKININGHGRYYIIYREASSAGLFSFYQTIMGELLYAEMHNYIPVIDMQHYDNVYLSPENKNKINAWEFFFDQPAGIQVDEALKKARIVRFSNGGIPAERPDDSMKCLTSLKDSDNLWRRINRKYIIKNNILHELVEKVYHEKFFDANGKKYSMLGVLCRGTDYLSLKPKFHPVQPTPQEVIAEVDRSLALYKFDRVFLVSEDKSIVELFQAYYKELLVVPSEDYKEYESGTYLKASIDKKNQEDRIRDGLDYAMRIMCLSKCDGFIAGRTSGTVAVMCQDHSFKYEYLFDLGRYE